MKRKQDPVKKYAVDVEEDSDKLTKASKWTKTERNIYNCVQVKFYLYSSTKFTVSFFCHLLFSSALIPCLKKKREGEGGGKIKIPLHFLFFQTPPHFSFSEHILFTMSLKFVSCLASIKGRWDLKDNS